MHRQDKYQKNHSSKSDGDEKDQNPKKSTKLSYYSDYYSDYENEITELFAQTTIIDEDKDKDKDPSTDKEIPVIQQVPQTTTIINKFLKLLPENQNPDGPRPENMQKTNLMTTNTIPAPIQILNSKDALVRTSPISNNRFSFGSHLNSLYELPNIGLKTGAPLSGFVNDIEPPAKYRK